MCGESHKGEIRICKIALFITNRIPIVIIKNCLLQSAPPLIFLALFILNNELVSTQLVCCLYLGGLDCYSPPTGRLLDIWGDTYAIFQFKFTPYAPWLNTPLEKSVERSSCNWAKSVPCVCDWKRVIVSEPAFFLSPAVSLLLPLHSLPSLLPLPNSLYSQIIIRAHARRAGGYWESVVKLLCML